MTQNSSQVLSVKSKMLSGGFSVALQAVGGDTQALRQPGILHKSHEAIRIHQSLTRQQASDVLRRESLRDRDLVGDDATRLQFPQDLEDGHAAAELVLTGLKTRERSLNIGQHQESPAALDDAGLTQGVGDLLDAGFRQQHIDSTDRCTHRDRQEFHREL